jgi:hypothetical protein
MMFVRVDIRNKKPSASTLGFSHSIFTSILFPDGIEGKGHICNKAILEELNAQKRDLLHD